MKIAASLNQQRKNKKVSRLGQSCNPKTYTNDMKLVRSLDLHAAGSRSAHSGPQATRPLQRAV
jgi:hypothetical protein